MFIDRYGDKTEKSYCSNTFTCVKPEKTYCRFRPLAGKSVAWLID